MEAVRFGRVVPALLVCTLHLRSAPRAFALRHQQGNPCVLRSADRKRGTVSYVSTEPQRTCPSCGNEFSGAMEFCPVVVLLEKLLEKDPAQRFQTPDELLKAMPTITGAIETRRGITRRNLHQIHPPTSRVGTRKPPARLGPKKISIARLPVTGSDVFGREEDIGFLNDAWANQQINVVTIIAWGGVGKSTLVNHWLRRMAAEQYRSAQLVFSWSFYRQGTSGGTSSANEFLDAALHWFWRSRSSAELHRLRGVFLTTLGAEEAQIEASFCEAIRIAKEQKSVSLQNRPKLPTPNIGGKKRVR